MKLSFVIVIFLFAQIVLAQNGDNLFLDNAKYLYAKTSSGTNTRILGINSGNNLYFGSVDAAVNNLFFNLNGQNRLTINGSDGKIGIGTTSPNEKLEVDGNILLTTDPANSSNNLSHSTSLRLMSSGYASDGRARYQNWKIQAVARSTWGSGDIAFFSNTDGAGYNERFRIMNDGNVGVGTSNPDSKLTVKGNIHAQEVKVDLSVPGPDYVFKEGYDLKSLKEIQDYIQEHGHLPNIPSAKEMEANGVQLGEMNMKLLEKIEELTLYILAQERRLKRMESLEQELKNQQKEIEGIKNILNN